MTTLREELEARGWRPAPEKKLELFEVSTWRSGEVVLGVVTGAVQEGVWMDRETALALAAALTRAASLPALPPVAS